jgi:hypothetical protein
MEQRLKQEIVDFCKLNEIPDVNGFLTECLQIGFNIKKYGDRPKIELKVIPKVEQISVEVDFKPTKEALSEEPLKAPLKDESKEDYELYD